MQRVTQGIKIAARIVRIVFTSVLAVILAFNLYFLASKAVTGDHPTLFGWSAAVVISGSMHPAIEVDDMVIIHRQSDYSGGDVIMYKDGSSLVTHRVEEVTETGYITKGDANNTSDPPVPADRVVGKVVLVIPKIGLLTAAMRTPLGMLVLILVGVGMIEAPSIVEKMKEKLSGKRENK